MNRETMNKLSKLIEREVRKQIKEQLSNMLLEFELVPKSAKRLPNVAKDSLIEEIELTDDSGFKPTRRKNSSKKFSSNPTLNSLLLDTANSSKSTPSQIDPEMLKENYRNLMGKDVFTSNDVDLVNYGSPLQTKAPLVTTGINGERLNASTEEGQKVQQALTRDYSELVKRFKK